MVAIALDTLRVSKRLRDAGFSEPQAETVTTILSETPDSAVKDLVTKQDLQFELAPIRADITLLKWMVGMNTALVVGVLVKLFVALP